MAVAAENVGLALGLEYRIEWIFLFIGMMIPFIIRNEVTVHAETSYHSFSANISRLILLWESILTKLGINFRVCSWEMMSFDAIKSGKWVKRVSLINYLKFSIIHISIKRIGWKYTYVSSLLTSIYKQSHLHTCRVVGGLFNLISYILKNISQN